MMDLLYKNWVERKRRNKRVAASSSHSEKVLSEGGNGWLRDQGVTVIEAEKKSMGL